MDFAGPVISGAHERGLIALWLLLLLTASYVISCVFSQRKPDSLSSQPTIGTRAELFFWSRAKLRSLLSTRQWAFEGYYKYSKSHLYYSLPSIDQDRVVIIPPRHIREVYAISDKSLDFHDTGNKTLQAQWTIWDRNIYDNSFHFDVVRNQITRNLDIITPPIAHELKLALEREWGVDTNDWVEVRAWNSSLKVIAGAANAAFCGPPLCRNPRYLKWLQHHASCLFGGSILINCTPAPFKSLVGVMIAGMTRFAFRKVARECLPMVKQRLRDMALLKEDPNHDWVPPADGLQWIIEEAYSKNDPKQLTPLGICHRLIFLNDVSMYSTAFTLQNVLLDLAASDPSLGYIEALREECRTVLREAGGSWTRQAVIKLQLVDSTVRESMRIHPFSSIGAPRTVIDPQGVEVPQGDATVRLPFGARVALPVEPIHYDESIYKDATNFHPFRFAGAKGFKNIFDNAAFEPNNSSSSETTPNAVSVNGDKPKASVTLDDSFLGFGFGRFACPGRFFVMNEVKMFVAEVLLNYDLDFLREGRPGLTPVIWLNVPFNDGKIRVRRRSDTAG